MKTKIINGFWLQLAGWAKQQVALLSSNHALFAEGRADVIKGRVQQFVDSARPHLPV